MSLPSRVVVSSEPVVRHALDPHASDADVRAARLLMGDGNAFNHSAMAGLVGADRCLHVLTGSGALVSDSPRLDPDSRRVWTEKPFRHHEHRVVGSGQKRGEDSICWCGNEETSIIHIKCWE